MKTFRALTYTQHQLVLSLISGWGLCTASGCTGTTDRNDPDYRFDGNWYVTCNIEDVSKDRMEEFLDGMVRIRSFQYPLNVTDRAPRLDMPTVQQTVGVMNDVIGETIEHYEDGLICAREHLNKLLDLVCTAINDADRALCSSRWTDCNMECSCTYKEGR